jgi:F-type H+-transporting ATPase subunit epsilon
MPLRVDIVAPDRVLWKGEATYVSAPAVEGSIGLLPGHVPILSVLCAGVVKVVLPDGKDHHVDITGGFLSFDHDMITIVAETVDAG